MIRPSTAADLPAIDRVHTEAFKEHSAVVVPLWRALLAHDPDALSLVAVDRTVVGHVLFTRAILDTPDRLVSVSVLSPLAVLPSHQRKGLGSSLVRSGLERLDALGVPLVLLEGDPRNYARLGFVRADVLGLRRPSLRIPPRAFQAYRLSAYTPQMTGTLVYPSPFWDHDAVGPRRTP